VRASLTPGSSRRFVWLVLPLLLAIGALSAQAQDKKGGPELRTVHGTVVDRDEQPVSGSVVYLLNRKSQAVRTYITDASGGYHFSGLDPNVDYEAHAEKEEMTSSSRTISSFDTRRDMQVTLKLSKKRGEH
jgi:protocatechuate 3,4-dioxygenase beta subunit